jgi:hypothetical protein
MHESQLEPYACGKDHTLYTGRPACSDARFWLGWRLGWSCWAQPQRRCFQRVQCQPQPQPRLFQPTERRGRLNKALRLKNGIDRSNGDKMARKFKMEKIANLTLIRGFIFYPSSIVTRSQPSPSFTLGILCRITFRWAI